MQMNHNRCIIVILDCLKLLGIFSRSEHESSEVRVNYWAKSSIRDIIKHVKVISKFFSEQ